MNSREKEVLQSQLNDEKAVLRKLKVVYSRAMADTETKIKAFQADIQLKQDALKTLTDEGAKEALQSEIQSKIYQQQYQQALKKQIATIFDNLQSNQYDTVKEYIDNSYTSGYVGTMYSLHGQGIPVITPIDQTQVVKAITKDTKLVKPLYQSLGYDVDKLKKSVNSEISRGIATALPWESIAKNIDKRTGISLNYAFRIARTEGHRVQQTAALNAAKAAIDAGADVFKQWDATLDDRTRSHHRMLDGQIRAVDDFFTVDGLKAKMPGGFGIASEDINCRCTLGQRARWGLDEDELKTLKDRAEFYGLDKTNDFEDFKKKYLNAAEKDAKIDKLKTIPSLIFKKATSIPEAESFAKDCGIERVSYKGVDLGIANSMNESLVNALNYSSNIKDRMGFYGSAQERNKLFKQELESYYTDYFLNNGYSPNMATKYAKQFASKVVGKVPSNCYAFASSGEIHGSNVDDTLKEICLKYSGICVNANNAKDYDAFLKSVESDVSVGWHPQGTAQVKAIFDHEFGHQLDYAYSLSQRDDIKKLYYGQSKDEIASSLSKYASTNIKEYIAEAYCEYITSPTPRETAKTIGKIIEGCVKK